MYIYLLAVDLFALAALFLGAVSFARENRSERLFPLIFLVIGRSVALIAGLSQFNYSPEIIGVLESFTTLCVVWVLIGSTWHLPVRWRESIGIGGALAVFFCFLPLLPIWPVPSALHNLIIAVAGASLVFVVQGQARWTHLTPPLLLGVANILALAGFMSVSWLATLLAYAVLLTAVHWEGMQTYREAILFFQDQQLVADEAAQAAADLSIERQRLLESREMLSNVPSLSQMMEHIVHSMARITHVDQSAIFMLDVRAMGLAHVVSVYSPERPFHITSRDEMVFELDNYPPLRQAIEEQQPLVLPQENSNGLRSVYRLWDEDRTGPTLIQPLAVQGRPVGALMLGNPVTRRAIPENDVQLCGDLAAQIAVMVEHRRRYLELELHAEAMAVTVQEQLSRQSRQQNGSFEPEPLDDPTPEARPEVVQETVAEAAPEATVAATVENQSRPEVEVRLEEQPTAAARPIQPDEIDEFLAVFEAIGEGIIVSDSTGRVKLVNKAAERILGRSRDVLIGQPIGTIYGEIDSTESIENLAVAFSRRNQPLPTFIENDDRAIQGRLIPWRNEQRDWLGIIAVFRDITREVKADEARNSFIAALSHELRAPLTMIKGYSELIAHSRMGDYSPEQVRVQRIIHSNSERMVEVLDNAIKLTMSDRNRFVAKFAEVNVTKVIDEALRDIDPLVQVRQIELVREIKEALPRIEADRRHLLRILDNLLSNACRFSPREGRVTLRAWTEAEPNGHIKRPHLLISVSDNGVGIPKKEIDQIFVPFYQVKGQKLDEKAGMGIGLAVVKELVELHNGRVSVESTVGVGSTFQIALPFSQEY